MAHLILAVVLLLATITTADAKPLVVKGPDWHKKKKKCHRGKQPNLIIAGCTALIIDWRTEAWRKPYAYTDRGIANAKNRDYNLAIRDFTQAINIDPRHRSAYLERGKSYFILGKYSLAIDDFTTLIESYPPRDWRVTKKAKAHYHRGLAYIEYEGDPRSARARADFQTLLLIHPWSKKAKKALKRMDELSSEGAGKIVRLRQKRDTQPAQDHGVPGVTIWRGTRR